MGSIRKKHTGAFKAKVALEAIKGDSTTAELSSKFGVHSNQISQWKKQALAGLPEIFSGKRKKKELDSEQLQDELYQQIGRLKFELEWLKKKSGLVD